MEHALAQEAVYTDCRVGVEHALAQEVVHTVCRVGVEHTCAQEAVYTTSADVSIPVVAIYTMNLV